MVAVTQTVESRFCWKGAAETVFVTASKALSHVKDRVDIFACRRLIRLSDEKEAVATGCDDIQDIATDHHLGSVTRGN